MNNIATSASLGLTPLRHNSFTVAASVEQASIVPEALDLAGGVFLLRGADVVILLGGTRPKWVIPGAVLKFSSTATAAREGLADGLWVVTAVTGVNGFSVAGTKTRNLSPATPEVPIAFTAGSATLRCECQRAILTPSGGSIEIAPFEGAGWTTTITDGESWEILAPQGAKFDLANWVYSGAAASILIL